MTKPDYTLSASAHFTKEGEGFTADSTTVRLTFPRVTKVRANSLMQKIYEKRVHDASRIVSHLPHVVAATCAKVFDETGVTYTFADLAGRKQHQAIQVPRRRIFWLLRHHPSTQYSLPEIGRNFNRDHSTVSSSLHREREELRRGHHERDALDWICNHLPEDQFQTCKALWRA